MTKPCNHYCNHDTKRVLNENGQNQPGCRHKPLFKMPIDHCVLDELHLMLRVTDRLEHGLIYDAVDWDEVRLFSLLLITLW